MRQVGIGKDRTGSDRNGGERFGLVWQVGRGEAWQGAVWYGEARNGWERIGKDWQAIYG